MSGCLWEQVDESGATLRCTEQAEERWQKAGVDLCHIHRGTHSSYRQAVYLIGDSRYVKIGISETPKARLSQLRSPNDKTVAPDDVSRAGLEMLGLATTGPDMEKLLHAALAEYHVAGEWFHRGMVVDNMIAAANLSPYWDKPLRMLGADL